MVSEYLVCTLLALLIVWMSIFKPRCYPPGPICVPFLGNIQVFLLLKKVNGLHHLLWHHLSKMYGPLVGLKFINKYLVIVSGKEMVKTLYNMEELNGRPETFFFRIRSFDKRLGVVFTDGALWEEQRLFSVKTLKSLGFGKTSMISSIECEAEKLIANLGKKCNSDISIQEESSNIFDISVMNVMWQILRGERFELDDLQIINLMENIHKSFRVVDMSGGILNHLPFVRHFFPDKSGFRPLVKTMEPLWEFLKANIQDVSRTYDKTLNPTNFIEFYIREMANQKTIENFFSHEQLLAICVDFFQAGSETTSNTLAFAVLYMLHFPDVMRKVKEELNRVVGTERLPKLIDRPNLKYCEAVVYEIQRLAMVAALGIAHRVVKSFKIGKYTIPKNTLVLFNLHSVHMDKNQWENPQQFKPERFLEDGKIKMNENFFPFGLGKRRCIGENLAKSSLFLFFTSIMHAFDIKPAGKLPNLVARDGITLSPQPFKAELNQSLSMKKIFNDLGN